MPASTVLRRRASGAIRLDAAGIGLLVAVALITAAIVVPAVTGWNVRVNSWPPLHAEWSPRVGPGTLPAVLLAVAAAVGATRWADRMPWPRLLAACFVIGCGWLLALATVDGWDGVGTILDTDYEYLETARGTHDVPAMLREYVSRIGYDAEPDNWPVHIAGHPPGAVLFFIALVRVGLGTGLEAGLVVTAVAATTPLAVLTTLKLLGAETHARRAAPFLVLGPAAVWQAVSADGMFAAVAAWGVAALTLAAVRRSWPWAVLAGVLLGYVVMMSYGLPLMGVVALAVLWLARSWRPLPVAALVAASLVLLFAVLGFAYWDALPEIRERYWEGVGGRRPWAYWMWGNLAALLFSAGPLAAAGLGRLVERWPHVRAEVRGGSDRGPETVLWVLAAAGWLMVLLADLSQMSRGEVERIWLPFVPWLLLGCALLPERWRRAGLVLQLVTALLVQHLLVTGW